MANFVSNRRSFLLGSTALALSSADVSAQPPVPDVAAQAEIASGFDYRKHNAGVLRRNSATTQPGTFEPNVSVNRATHFSKALKRVSNVAPPGATWGLATEDAFAALMGAVEKAYNYAIHRPLVHAGRPTDYEALEIVADFIGDPDFVDNPEDDPSKPVRFRFTNPLGGLSMEVEGLDPAATRITLPPAFESQVTAAEMIGLYWAAQLRDVRFSALASATQTEADAEDRSQRQKVAAAITDLNNTNYYRSIGGLSEDRLFRADLRDAAHPTRYGFPGAEVGPYLSQFLLRGTPEPGAAGQIAGPQLGVVNFGTLRLSQRQRTVQPGTSSNYLYAPTMDRSGMSWHGVQNGDRRAIGQDKFVYPSSGGSNDRETEAKFRDDLKFITTLRDGANYVHFDKIYQEYLVAACIILAGLPRVGDTVIFSTQRERQASLPLEPLVAEFASRDDILNFGNPYRGSRAQVGFATFGVTHIVTLLSEVSTRAHKAGWYHKWLHRRIRPEEFGARVHVNLSGTKDQNGRSPFPLNSDLDPSRSPVLDLVKAMNGGGSYLLPQAFPEGCPTHPAYPSGHATVAGACVTVLKALFDESRGLAGEKTIPNVPVYVPDANGLNLMPANQQPLLSVGGELNKLASNITSFREFAGVHWKSDSVQGILLGEQVALKLLIEQSASAPGTGGGLLPFYRERKSVGSLAPFFRLSLFSAVAVDIEDGRIFRVEDAFEKSGSARYRPQDKWLRREEISFSELVRLQGFPSYA